MGSNSKGLTYSADYGRRLLPTLIDHIAATDPSRPFASLPKSTDPRDGFQDINYSCFASAINRCCWWLERELGRPRCEFEKVAYLTAASDIRYAIFVIAAIKTGYVVCLILRLQCLLPNVASDEEVDNFIFSVTDSTLPLSWIFLCCLRSPRLSCSRLETACLTISLCYKLEAAAKS